MPAGDLESIVQVQLRRALPDEAEVSKMGLHAQRAIIGRHVERVEVHRDRIDIRFIEPVPDDRKLVSIPTTLGRRGRETRIAVSPTDRMTAERDPSLIKLVMKAQMAREAIAEAGDRSISEIAAEQGYTRDYFGVLLCISWLARPTCRSSGRRSARCSGSAEHRTPLTAS